MNHPRNTHRYIADYCSDARIIEINFALIKTDYCGVLIRKDKIMHKWGQQFTKGGRVGRRHVSERDSVAGQVLNLIQ